MYNSCTLLNFLSHSHLHSVLRGFVEVFSRETCFNEAVSHRSGSDEPIRYQIGPYSHANIGKYSEIHFL